MGTRTEMKLESFAEATGIKPAEGEMQKALLAVQRHAFELIKVIELERSGVRDGHGCWIGSDPLCGTVRDIEAAWERVAELDRQRCRGGDSISAQAKAAEPKDTGHMPECADSPEADFPF